MFAKRSTLLLCSLLCVTALGKLSHASEPVPEKTLSLFGEPVAKENETEESIGPDYDQDAEPAAPVGQDAIDTDANEPLVVETFTRGGYRLPAFNRHWGLSRRVYERAEEIMAEHGDSFANQRYVALVDMSKHSSQKRFFLFDLENGTLQKYHVAHGSGSDPRNTGYARRFSNSGRSHMTALGAYRTLQTFHSRKHGLALRLSGLERTNNRALQRAIIVHGARYVSERRGRAGRSWGCPAVDKALSSGLVKKIRGGALLLIWR